MNRDIFDDRRGFAAARSAFVTKQTRPHSHDAWPTSMATSTPVAATPGPAAA